MQGITVKSICRYGKNRSEKTLRARRRRAKTLVESAYGAPQHLNYYAQRDTTKSIIFKCWAFIVPTLVTITRWSPPAGKHSTSALSKGVYG